MIYPYALSVWKFELIFQKSSEYYIIHGFKRHVHISNFLGGITNEQQINHLRSINGNREISEQGI